MGSADQGAQHRDTVTRLDASRMTEDTSDSYLRRVEAAMRDGSPAAVVFARLHEALANAVGFKVLTVLKLDPTTLRSVRLLQQRAELSDRRHQAARAKCLERGRA